MSAGNRRGIVLLQVLVMSVLLALLSAGILRWVLSRHYLVGKHRKTLQAGANLESCMNEFIAYQNGALPASNGSYTCSGGLTLSYSRSAANRPYSISISTSGI